MRNVKTTLENLVAILNDGTYSNGIDPITMSHTVDDIYRFVSGDKNSRIRCPAPVDNLDNRFRLLWPEGATVTSRPTSDASRTSRTSHRSGRSHHLSSRYTSGNINPDLTKRAMSVTSSQYSKRYVGFIEEEDEDDYSTAPPHRSNHRSNSSASKSSSTMRVNGAVVKPTPSLEKMFASNSIADSCDQSDNCDTSLPDKSYRKPYAAPALSEHTSANGGRRGKRYASKIGFGDE